MPDQLPRGAEGAAAVTLIFASISWICSAVMIWLTWVHNQRSSYVALVAYITIISTTASIIQQIHDIALWREVMTEQFQHRVKDPDNADLQIANGSVGMDLVLFYIQFYCYNVEALLITFWASELVQSIYSLNERPATARILEKVNAAGKIVALVVPVLFIVIVRAPAINNSVEALVHIVGIPLIISLGCGSLLMLAILFRYIQTRRKLVPFFTGSLQSTDPGSSKSRDRNRISWGLKVLGSNGLYDRWLMTRFTLSFVLLGVFQATSFIFQRFSAHNTEVDVQSANPDLSPTRARQTLFLFIPGNTPGVALFIVFGTTTAFRRHMYRTFMPRRWQKQEQLEMMVPPSSIAVTRMFGNDHNAPSSFSDLRRTVAPSPAHTPRTVFPDLAPGVREEYSVIKSPRHTRGLSGETIDTVVGYISSSVSVASPAREEPVDPELGISMNSRTVIPPTTPEASATAHASVDVGGHAHIYSKEYAHEPRSYNQSEVRDDRDPASILIYEPSTGRWRTGNT